MPEPSRRGTIGLRLLAGELRRLTSAPAVWFADFVDSAEEIWTREPCGACDDEALMC